MGTEVLLPQDILGSRRLVGFGPSGVTISTDASLFPRRRLTPNCCSGGGGGVGGVTGNPRPHRRPEHRRRREGSPRPAATPAGKVGSGGNGGGGNLVMGKVTILRRGESLDSVTGKGLSRKEGKRVGKAATPVVLSSEAGGDLIVFGTGRLGPEPASVPKQSRLVGVRTGARAGRAEMYAGPAFSLSPSPRALPLPTFSSRKPWEGDDEAHQYATRDLRRLLRLD